MSTEFVRCPACRSLIPAVSKVCRMCGAELAPGASRSEEEGSKKSGRVRQRTMSQTNEELAQAAHQLRADFSPSTPPEPAFVQHSPEAGGYDPLSAYIEEIDSGAISTMAGANTSPSESHEKQRAPSGAFVGAGLAGSEIDAGQTVVVNPESFESAKPRVIVESGARRTGKASGLSFGKARDEGQQAKQEARSLEQPKLQQNNAQPPREHAPMQSRTGMNLGKSPAKVTKPVNEQADLQQEHDSNVANLRSDHGQQDNVQTEHEQQDNQPRTPARATRAQHIPLKGGKISAGRLFGWLVSFKESDGRAIELREGRFFVTRSSVKEADLIIDHDSISVPHALMHISSDLGLRVHDVISEKGLYVRRRNSDEYQRMSETVEIQHGDYLRFGEVEFQVCLIAEVGATK